MCRFAKLVQAAGLLLSLMWNLDSIFNWCCCRDPHSLISQTLLVLFGAAFLGLKKAVLLFAHFKEAGLFLLYLKGPEKCIRFMKAEGPIWDYFHVLASSSTLVVFPFGLRCVRFS